MTQSHRRLTLVILLCIMNCNLIEKTENSLLQKVGLKFEMISTFSFFKGSRSHTPTYNDTLNSNISFITHPFASAGDA